MTRLYDPSRLAEALRVRGFITHIGPEEMVGVGSGALHFGGPAALQELLDLHRGVIRHAGWPETPQEFLDRVAREWVSETKRLYRVIAHAFGDVVYVDREEPHPDDWKTHPDMPGAGKPMGYLPLDRILDDGIDLRQLNVVPTLGTLKARKSYRFRYRQQVTSAR
jgi:hypothetical protein